MDSPRIASPQDAPSVPPDAVASMAARQGATPPRWLGRSRLSLLVAVIGGWRQNLDKLVQWLSLSLAYWRPGLVRRRLERLRGLGHIDAVPTLAQMLVAGRDQIMVSASDETKIFYRSQGIPWIFHNVRRFISGPATMLDPIGLFSPRDTIVHHVLQTFHRHPLYDLVLLRAYDGGLEEMARQAEQVRAGTHPHQNALTSLIEDGAYHDRLSREVAEVRADPFVAARPIPPGLVDDAQMMLAMDQFKDIRGFTSYAARLRVGLADALRAWVLVAFDETLGGWINVKLGPRRIEHAACDPEILGRHPDALTRATALDR